MALITNAKINQHLLDQLIIGYRECNGHISIATYYLDIARDDKPIIFLIKTQPSWKRQF